jgi:hypothetical protein
VAPPELAQVGKPGAEEAARILQQFRQAGLLGEFYLEFEFRAMPRRGEERLYPGRLWGGRTPQGTAFRIEVRDGSGGTGRWLLRNGAKSAAWKVVDGQVLPLSLASSLEPLFPGVEITAFDLQMPFLYWEDATLDRLARVFGRPSYAYVFRPPAGERAALGAVAAARAYLDTQFNALMQTELLDDRGRVLKSFALISLKRVGEQHVPKQADYRNDTTRDKTRFQVTAVALNLQLPAAVFAPAALATPLEPPEAALRVRID